MKVKLIPVINLEVYGLKNLEYPKNGPYWEFAKEWDLYNKKARIRKGYSSSMKPYVQGATFYEIDQFSDIDLSFLIQNQIDSVEEDEDVSLIEQLYSIDGGCVLNVNGIDVLLPQCCSNLNCFHSWIDLFLEPNNHFYQGHPSPKIKVTENKILIDLVNHHFKGESFAQKITVPQIELDSADLIKAIELASTEFDLLRQRIRRLKLGTDWDIVGLENILVFEKIIHK